MSDGYKGFNYVNTSELTVDAQQLLAVITRMAMTREGLDENRKRFAGNVGRDDSTVSIFEFAMRQTEVALVSVLRAKARIKRDLGAWDWKSHKTHCTICGLELDDSGTHQAITIPQGNHLADEEHQICEDCLREAGVE